MRLETKHAAAVISLLEDAQDVGMTYVVFELRPMEHDLQPHQLDFFDTLGDALDHLEMKSGWGLPMANEFPVYYKSVEDMLEAVKQQNGLTNNKDMNRTNLENLQEEMKKLGLSKKTMEEVQQKMEKGLSEFTAQEQRPGVRGTVDITAFFRQSSQSDNYYLNKFEVALSTAKPLEEGHKYFVISPDPAKEGKNLSRGFSNVTEAINYFKEQTGDSRLGVGKDAGHTRELAAMKNGKEDYIEKDFQHAYRTPARTQTFFVERGKGFNVEQGVNMIQGRSVFRDDLLNLGGSPYAAWVKLDMDGPKDKYHNYGTNQYNVPAYGFETKAALDQYQIKELQDPKRAEQIEQALNNGNRPLVTVQKDGQETKLFLEASPRYRQLNFFREDGKPERREQFMKPEVLKEDKQELQKGKGQGKGQEQGMAV